MKKLMTLFALLSISFSVFAVEQSFNVKPGELPSVVGKVVSNGQPVAGLPVQLVTSDDGNKTTVTTQTRPDGTYQFYEIPEGKYTLNVLAGGDETKSFKDIDIDGPQTTLSDVNVTTGQMVTSPGNFRIVVDGAIYRGARPVNEGQVEWLRQNLKVKTIIDLQGGDPWYVAVFEPGEKQSQRNLEEKWAQTDNHITWINKPMDSVGAVHCREAQRINHILDIIRDPKNQPVYIHCEHGKDRTGLIAALYESFYEEPNVPPAAAHAEMIADGHNTYVCGAMDTYFNLATAAPMSLHKLDNPQCDKFSIDPKATDTVGKLEAHPL